MKTVGTCMPVRGPPAATTETNIKDNKELNLRLFDECTTVINWMCIVLCIYVLLKYIVLNVVISVCMLSTCCMLHFLVLFLHIFLLIWYVKILLKFSYSTLKRVSDRNWFVVLSFFCVYECFCNVCDSPLLHQTERNNLE